mgnify:CR=1 FL=1
MKMPILCALLGFTWSAFGLTNTPTLTDPGNTPPPAPDERPTHAPPNAPPPAKTATEIAFGPSLIEEAPEPALWPEAEGLNPLAFELGTRITRFRLKTTHKTEPTFIGHVDTLEAQQELALFRPFVAWRPVYGLGLELTWDEVRAKTFNKQAQSDPEPISDGEFIINGPILTLTGKFKNTSRFEPSAGLGFAFLNAGFNHAAWWHYGFGSYEHWLSTPEAERYQPYKGGMRYFHVKDTTGFVFTMGCDYKVTEHAMAEAYFRYMAADVDAYYTDRAGREHAKWTSIPLDNYVFGLGFHYAF